MNSKPCLISMKFAVWTLEYLSYILLKLWLRSVKQLPSYSLTNSEVIFIQAGVFIRQYMVVGFSVDDDDNDDDDDDDDDNDDDDNNNDKDKNNNTRLYCNQSTGH